MLIGGVAVIAHGAARTTLDVDATILGSESDPASVVRRWAPFGLEPRVTDAVEFAAQSQVLLLRDAPHDVPVDVTLAWLPFEEQAIARAIELPFGSGTVRVPRLEDLIVYKLVASRPRDVDDVEKLLAIHPNIRSDEVLGTLRDFADVLGKPEIVETLERLLRK